MSSETRSWLYKNRNEWVPYSDQIQQIIERNYTSGKMRFDVTIGDAEYEIDLICWRQINKLDATRTRGIKVEGPRLSTAVTKQLSGHASLLNFCSNFLIPGPLQFIFPGNNFGVLGKGRFYAKAEMTPKGPTLDTGISFKF